MNDAEATLAEYLKADARMLQQFGLIGLAAFGALVYFQVWIFSNLPVESYYIFAPSSSEDHEYRF